MDELSTINLNLNGTTPNNKVRHLHFPSYIRRRIPAADYYRKRVVRLHDLKIDAMKETTTFDDISSLNCDKADQHKSSKLENSRCETNIKTERAKKKIDGFIPKRIDKEDEAYHENPTKSICQKLQQSRTNVYSKKSYDDGIEEMSCLRNQKYRAIKTKKRVQYRCMCLRSYNPNASYVKCASCNVFYHKECVGVNEANPDWNCDDCKKPKRDDLSKLYCLCAERESGFYVCCDVCCDWFHADCIKKTKEELKESSMPTFKCPCCS